VQIELIESKTVSDRDIAAWHDCFVACTRNIFPDEPLPPVDFTADLARNPGTHRPRRYFLAWDDKRSRVLGYAETHWHDGAESHRIQTYVDVVPDARRNGIGRALVDAVRAAATTAGRTSLLGSAPYAGVGIDFARAVGAKFGLDEMRSVYRLGVPPAPVPAVDGLSIVSWDAHCPDEHLMSFADLRAVMNTAPQGGNVEYPDDIWDADRVRRIESTLREQSVRLYVVTARDDSTSELVGYTEVALFDTWAEFGEQWDTGVLPAYRGRGVASWVKTEMLLRLHRDFPALQLLVTWNAAVNDSMLAVNKRLGYGERQRWVEAEVTV
jgi:GNAT superfamily N-acetyltransferase